MTEKASPVGLIGLGLMGTAITRRLLAAGFKVIGTDVSGEARARFAALGGEPVESVGAIAAACTHVVLAVFDTGQVEDVVAGKAGLTATP